MKLQRYIAVSSILLMSVALASHAQSVYEAGSAANQTLNGTARFLGSGGALNAIGGDVSTISYNPAGLGVYSTDELTLTLNTHWTNTRFGQQPRESWPYAAINNAAYVKTMTTGHETGLKSWNMAFTYNSVQSFKRRGSYIGNSNSSMADFLAAYSTGLTADDMSYENENTGWASVLAYDAHLISPDGDGWKSNVSENENANSFSLNESSINNEFALSFGWNFNNKVFAGVSFVGHYLDYNLYSSYTEEYSDNLLGNTRSYQAHGAGFTGKIGIIYKPSKWVRLGAAFHTPGIYLYNDKVATSFRNNDSIYSSPYYDTFFRSRLQTPLKASASIGIHLGKYGIFGLDYQFTNFQNTRVGRDKTAAINSKTGIYLRDQHVIRGGFEIRPIDWFSLRIGAGYYSPYTSQNMADALLYNDTDTEIGYYTDGGSYSINCGIGFKFNIQYLDFAYVYQAHHGTYHPYSTDFANEWGGSHAADEICLPLRTINNQILITYGLKF